MFGAQACFYREFVNSCALCASAAVQASIMMHGNVVTAANLSLVLERDLLFF